MLTLHQFEISPFCDKIRRVLRYKKVPFEIREVSLFEAGTGALRRRNGTGKLPMIEHDGTLVTDSSDIAHYLEARFPERPLVPADPRLAADSHLLEDWADESLYFCEAYLRFCLPHNARRWVPRLVHIDRAPMRALAPVMVPRVVGKMVREQGTGKKSLEQVLLDVNRHLGALEAKLEGRAWLVGDAITLGDISVFAQLFCVRGADEGARAIAERPRVTEWMARVEAATA